MKTRQRLRAMTRFLIILTLLLQGRAVAENRTLRSGIQTTMHESFQALTSAFPWSLDEQQFQAPEHRQRLLAALRTLAQQAGQLETHGQDMPQSFGYLRRSLARSAQDAAQRYAQGQYQQARFLLVVASSLLHRWLDTQPTDKSAIGEAYYLLGVTETSLAWTTWLSEAPFFLETAIRLDPTSAVAAQAYNVLNTYILTEYTGSLGTRVPPDVQEHLEELRRLREGS